MTKLFLELLNLSITASILILIILVLRFLLQKAPMAPLLFQKCQIYKYSYYHYIIFLKLSQEKLVHISFAVFSETESIPFLLNSYFMFCKVFYNKSEVILATLNYYNISTAKLRHLK